MGIGCDYWREAYQVSPESNGREPPALRGLSRSGRARAHGCVFLAGAVDSHDPTQIRNGRVRELPAGVAATGAAQDANATTLRDDAFSMARDCLADKARMDRRGESGSDG